MALCVLLVVNEKRKKDFQIVQPANGEGKRINASRFSVLGCRKFPSPSTSSGEKQDDGKIPFPSSSSP
jgi:hypothetical protein